MSLAHPTLALLLAMALCAGGTRPYCTRPEIAAWAGMS